MSVCHLHSKFEQHPTIFAVAKAVARAAGGLPWDTYSL